MDLVYTVVLPLVAIVGMAIIGYLRGARREAYVSGSIALAQLMALQWGGFWGRDLASFMTGLSAGDASFYVVLAILILTVLVIGYGLGSSMVRGTPTSTSRVLGLLLGALNGAALSGWLLRSGFEYLEGSRGTSPIYTNLFSYSLMVVAGWFAVALAALGAIVTLVRAFRDDSDEVTVKTERTTVVAPTTPMPPATAQPAYGGYGGYGGYGQQPQQPPRTGYIPSGQGSSDPTAPTAAYTAPPWTERGASSPQIDSAQNQSSGYSYTPPSGSSWPLAAAVEKLDETPTPDAASAETREVETVDIITPAASTSTSEVASGAVDTSATTVIPTDDAKYHTPPFGMPAVSAFDAEPASSTDGAGATGATEQRGGVAAAATSEGRKCRVCSAAISPGQVFCTECGTRVEETPATT
jgi:hypothetical protein